ncbi:MAG: archaeosortase/exosortase family protein [Caldisericia bacterium]|nr:archaeosortase/exosortase family protein [Caldisericia bacterium]
MPPIQNALLGITTSIVNFLLEAFGYETMVLGNKIALTTGTEMKFTIIPDCTGVYPFIILIGLIGAFPIELSKRLVGVLGAFVTTFSINYIRLILLVAIGHKSREMFQYAHIFIFQISFILLIVIYFLWWVKWIMKNSK